MTNNLVGDVYAKIIEEVVSASSGDFEEYAVPSSTLQELQQEWQAKLSQRSVAQMPWDPKPAPPPQVIPTPTSSVPATTPNGAPQSNFPSYDGNQSATANGAPRVKVEPKSEPQYNGHPNYPPNPVPTQGGLARAQQLVQQQYGPAANASLNAMQRGGLALPGQNVKPPQGMQLPPTNAANNPHQFQLQQQAAMMRQQQQFQQDPAHPRIKTETDSPNTTQGSFDPLRQAPNYGQTDGADDLEEWRAMLAARRAISADQTQNADRMMHDRVMNLTSSLQSGLLLPLDEQPSRNKRRMVSPSRPRVAASGPAIPQLDGEFDDDDDDDAKPDVKPDVVKDEDDENAINSDLDDPDEDGQGAIGGEDDDDGDAILCTYDKVQRVKNKWKCTLKDGIMTVDGKEWVFHKGTGEFEW